MRVNQELLIMRKGFLSPMFSNVVSDPEPSRLELPAIFCSLPRPACPSGPRLRCRKRWGTRGGSPQLLRSASPATSKPWQLAGRLSPTAHPQKNAYRLQVETPKVYLNNAVAHYGAADWQFLSLATYGTRPGGQEVLIRGF